MVHSSAREFTFVVASNDDSILDRNFLASPCFKSQHNYQILVQRHFASATKAYNDALRQRTRDLLIFVHQDIVLPEAWISDLELALAHLDATDPHWGVLGCAGMRQNGTFCGHVYSSGRGTLGRHFEYPQKVQTLDEIVLIVRKSSGLWFDDTLPHFHLYGTDLCLRAASLGMNSYAMSAYCIHNTQEVVILPEEFYECCRHVAKVWRHRLPIQTTCVRLSRWNLPILIRRLRETYLCYVRRDIVGGARAENVDELLDEVLGCKAAVTRAGLGLENEPNG
jgi:hypothetical protein